MPIPDDARSAGNHELDAVAAVRALARASRMLERASGDVGLSQYRVLAAVADGDARASRIAARLALGKPAISATVVALCQRGLLVRIDDESDQRATRLVLTAAGARTLADIEQAMVTRVRALAARTGRASQLIASLVRLGEAIEDLQVERATQ